MQSWEAGPEWAAFLVTIYVVHSYKTNVVHVGLGGSEDQYLLFYYGTDSSITVYFSLCCTCVPVIL